MNFSNSIYTVYASYALDQLLYTAQVYLNTETEGYDIFYTLNGDEPTVNANKYKGAFTAENRSVVKAGLFNKDGKLLGRITETKIK